MVDKRCFKILKVLNLQTVIVYEVNVFISKYFVPTNEIVLGNAWWYFIVLGYLGGAWSPYLKGRTLETVSAPELSKQ